MVVELGLPKEERTFDWDAVHTDEYPDRRKGHQAVRFSP